MFLNRKYDSLFRIQCRVFDACSFKLKIFRFWLSEKRRRRRKRRTSIFTTPKRKRFRGAAAERTPVGTGRICSGAALQALEIGPLCLRACALLRNKYGSFGRFDRSTSALRAMRERGGTHTAWYASRRDMTVSHSMRAAAALFSRSTPTKPIVCLSGDSFLPDLRENATR